MNIETEIACYIGYLIGKHNSQETTMGSKDLLDKVKERYPYIKENYLDTVLDRLYRREGLLVDIR